MDYTEKMNKCWEFIRRHGITDDPKDEEGIIFVENIGDVQDAYCVYLDKKERLLREGWDRDEAEFAAFGFDCEFEWLDYHGIKWEEMTWRDS